MSNAMSVTAGQALDYLTMFANGFIHRQQKDPSVRIPATYLEGEPGCGKSSVARQLAKRLNYAFVLVSANQRSPDDVIGVQMPNPDTKTTDWYAPTWLPNEDGSVVIDGITYDGTVLCFDELASADDRVRKPLFGVFLDGCTNGRKLPPNCLVIATGNEAETGTLVFEFDNATRLRFITLRIKADLETWLIDYAADADLTPAVVATLKNNIGLFCQTADALDKGHDIYGNPRSWSEVSELEKSIMLNPKHRNNEDRITALIALAAGKVGSTNAETYRGVLANLTGMTTFLDILEASRAGRDLSQMWPTSLHQMQALSFSMMAYPRDIATAQEIYALLKKVPDSSQVPFAEMKPAVQESILKRLRKLGHSSKALEVFSADNRQLIDELGTGPIIKIAI